MSDILSSFSTRRTPQNRPASGKQRKNSAGGHSFKIDDEARLRRFLTLGSDGGTYYVGAEDLTRENAEVVVRMAEKSEDSHRELVDTIVDISTRGAAPKNDPALFALAIAASHGSEVGRTFALSYLNQVARTGTHILTFARYVQQFRGWGRGLRRAVAKWYTGSTDWTAYQAVKYRQRKGFSHRDLLRLSHPEVVAPERRALFEWITRGNVGEHTPRLIEGFLKAQKPGAFITHLIREYDLTWEMLPDSALNDARTWEVLLDRIPITALIRQLPRLTRLGLTDPLTGTLQQIVSKITSKELLLKGRVHPMNILVALRTYASGMSQRGTSNWEPSPDVIDALDDAFYLAFDTVKPANKRTMIGLDVSGSMSFTTINGLGLSPRVASAALALVQVATEPQIATYGFTGDMTPLRISPKQRLDDVIKEVSGYPFGPTDCAQPMVFAKENNMLVDTFIIYTDSETWSGRTHPHQALAEYRRHSGIDAKLVVVGMTATDFSIADPDDPGMLDIAGFDVAVPNLITEFSKE